jgi:phthiodiolone/phenolphthiodiolone dimycocerosates ketoreductase
MKVGSFIWGQHPMEAAYEGAHRATQAGFDSLWMPDHLLGVYHPGLWPDMPMSAASADPDAFYDPFLALALVGERHPLPMGVAVTDGTRRRAADLARTALTLNHVCQGGFNLGIGAGEAENLTPYGYSFATPVSTLEECLEELRSILDTGAMRNDPVARTGLPLQRPDHGRPKIWVAGHGPRMLRLTGRYGDGWIPSSSRMDPAEYASRKAVVAQAASAAGRAEPEAGMVQMIHLGESRDHVYSLMEKQPLGKLAALFRPPDRWQAHGLTHPCATASGFDIIVHQLDPDDLRDLAKVIPGELLEEWWCFGNAEEIAERLSPYADKGLEHVVIANSTGTFGGMDVIGSTAAEFEALPKLLSSL